MLCRLSRRSVSSLCKTSTSAKDISRMAALLASLLIALPGFAQDQPEVTPEPGPQQEEPQQQAKVIPQLTIPAGTRIALVLTQPIQSRYIHRGDDIYAQVNSPVNSGNEVVIPVGTFVQAKVDKLERKGDRAILQLSSMSITFPDGYVTPLAGPMTIQTDAGYAQKDPGKGRIVGAFALPAAGAGLGALIGHAAGHSTTTTLPGLPPFCGVPTPGCTQGGQPLTLTDNSSSLKSTAIGSMVGLAAGGVGSLALLLTTRNFYLYAGAPAEMVLPQPISIPQEQVAQAVRDSEQHPIATQPVVQPPPPPPVSEAPTDHGTCYTPGTPGTPPTVIPGAPGPDGTPGPPTIIPGIPPSPGTPYPCP